MTYHQLTEHERYLISSCAKPGTRWRRSPASCDRHPSTIYREYQRNSTQVRNCLTYCPSKAQERRNGRLRRSRRGPHHEAWQYARVDVSATTAMEPGADCRHPHGMQEEFQISFQTIYRHVRRDWRAGGQLYLELRRRYKRASATTGWSGADACRASA